MKKKIQKLKWDLHQQRYRMLLLWGLNNGKILPYDEELITKLRDIYYGGIPASVILLSNGMSNGHCYDRATLMSRAFLDTEDDVNLLYASIDSLKLNPAFIRDDPMYADHCIVERTTSDGRKLIYDTSCGFVFDKDLYWKMEHPKVRYVNGKESIKKFIEADEDYFPEDIERDKYASPLILPFIEMTYGRPTEMYTMSGIELLQREIKLFKEKIDYDGVVKEIDEDMKRIGAKRRGN